MSFSEKVVLLFLILFLILAEEELYFNQIIGSEIYFWIEWIDKVAMYLLHTFLYTILFVPIEQNKQNIKWTIPWHIALLSLLRITYYKIVFHVLSANQGTERKMLLASQRRQWGVLILENTRNHAILSFVAITIISRCYPSTCALHGTMAIP